MNSVLGLDEQLSASAARLAQRLALQRRRRRLIVTTVLALLAVAGVAAAARQVWSPSLGDDKRGHPTASTDPPPESQLALLGVLRRDANEHDRDAPALNALRFLDPSLKGIRTDWVRVVRSGDDRTTSVMVPVAQAKDKRDAVCLFTPDTDGGALSCWTTAEIQSGAAVMGLGGRVPTLDDLRRRKDGTIGTDVHPVKVTRASVTGVVMGLVPDGVAQVEVPGSPASHGGRVSVTDNFFAAVGHPPQDPSQIRWFADDGQEVQH